MRVNNPKSIIFIDGVSGVNPSLENFATLSHVSNEIDKSVGFASYSLHYTSIPSISSSVNPSFNAYIEFYEFQSTEGETTYTVGQCQNNPSSNKIETHEIWFKFNSDNNYLNFDPTYYQILGDYPEIYNSTSDDAYGGSIIYVFTLRMWKSPSNNNIYLLNYSHQFSDR